MGTRSIASKRLPLTPTQHPEYLPDIVCQTPQETSLLARPSPTPTQIADPRINDVTMTSHHRRQRSIGSVNLPSESIQSTIAARWARINQISHNYQKHKILPKYQRFNI